MKGFDMRFLSIGLAAAVVAGSAQAQTAPTYTAPDQSDNASYGAAGVTPVPVTVGATYFAGRSLQANCSTAGTITFIEDGVAIPWIVAVGTQEIPHASTEVSSSGSASCTFFIHY